MNREIISTGHTPNGTCVVSRIARKYIYSAVNKSDESCVVEGTRTGIPGNGNGVRGTVDPGAYVLGWTRDWGEEWMVLIRWVI